VLLPEHTENHADDPTWWWTLVGYLKAHHFAGRLHLGITLIPCSEHRSRVAAAAELITDVHAGALDRLGR